MEKEIVLEGFTVFGAEVARVLVDGDDVIIPSQNGALPLCFNKTDFITRLTNNIKQTEERVELYNKLNLKNPGLEKALAAQKKLLAYFS